MDERIINIYKTTQRLVFLEQLQANRIDLNMVQVKALLIFNEITQPLIS